MTELWLDDAPGERRGALVEDGQIVEIHIQRHGYLPLGATGSGRIVRKTPSGIYVATGTGPEILVRSAKGPPEGSRVSFEITREAIAEPGRLKSAEAELAENPVEVEKSNEDLWNEQLAALGTSRQQEHDISGAFDIALAGRSQVADMILCFQRTKAGLVFDVDGTGDPLTLNLAATAEIARLLRLYQVGGMVMIDFISVDSKTARRTMAEAFDNASAVDPRPFERSAVNGFGLMQVVRARPRPSVLDHLFGTRIASPSDETQALQLLREAVRSTGFGIRTIHAPPPVANLLLSPAWQDLREACERTFGSQLAVVADSSVAGYGHVHVRQA